jgi:hypothetical protein
LCCPARLLAFSVAAPFENIDVFGIHALGAFLALDVLCDTSITHGGSMTSQTKHECIEIDELMSGAYIVRADDVELAVGFPEEIVKAWLTAQATPIAWLVPDIRCVNGIVQWAFEFPLYYALFVQGLLARNERIPVLVQRRDWNDFVDYLRLTLLGANHAELNRAGVSVEKSERLLRESAYLALKRSDGKVAQIEDLVEAVFFDDNNEARLAGLTVHAHGKLRRHYCRNPLRSWCWGRQRDLIHRHLAPPHSCKATGITCSSTVDPISLIYSRT